MLKIDKPKANEIVNMFPYEIQDRGQFYDRNHPVLNPESFAFDDYWDKHEKRVIEGHWVNDKGTWVYMPGKLYFYINIAKIRHADDGSLIKPWLRDVEWIIFSYIMCCDGFSGFEFDDEYTCEDLVRRIEEGEELDRFDKAAISEHARNKEGEFKKYMDPYDYLTKGYLLMKRESKPLGRAVWNNDLKNGILFSGRGVGKSMSIFVGDFTYEFLFGTVKRIEDLAKANNELKFFIGARDSSQLQRTWDNVRTIYYNMPGKFEFSEEDIYYGPWFKNIYGTWNVKTGSKIQHIVKSKKGKDLIKGSSAEVRPIVKENLSVSSGDRFRRIYVEEVGLVEDIDLFYSYNKDSMRRGTTKVGSSFYLGTSGNLKTIRKPKKIFDNPQGYDIFGITDLWKNKKRKIGLFIPAPYRYDKYRNENGFVDLELAYNQLQDEREVLEEHSDSVAYDKEVMNNPFTPEEMMIPTRNAILPVAECRNQISDLEDYGTFKARAMMGDLVYNPLEPYGIEFIKDLHNKKKPILYYRQDEEEINLEGSFIMYEQPPATIPERMYYVIFDPVSKDGDGSSLNSVLVYKHTFTGQEGSIQDNIVAEWIGRLPTLNQTYEFVIKVAKFFNATIFPEVNVGGFVDYCKRKNHFAMLESDAYLLKQEVHGGKAMKRGYYQVGFQMNSKREKFWCLQKLRDWLMEVKKTDPSTGIPIARTINQVFSIRALDEIINYNEKDNFDHISSLLGLMFLIGKLEAYPVKKEYKEETIKYYTETPQEVKRRPEFLNY